MYNKKNILITSVLISLSVFSIKEVEAEEIVPNSKDNIGYDFKKNTQTKTLNSKEIDELLTEEFQENLDPEDLKEIYVLLEDDNIDTELLLNAISAYQDESFEEASVSYEEFLKTTDLNEEELSLIEALAFIKDGQEESESSTAEATGGEQEDTEETKEIKKTQETLKAKTVHEATNETNDELQNDEDPQTFNIARSDNSSSMYQAVIDSSFASESWELALQYQEAFGTVGSELEQVNAAINHAAQNVLNLGIRRFEDKQYHEAINYFEMLLPESSIEASLKSSIQNYHTKARSTVMYQAVMDSNFATESWELALQYQETYGNVSSERAQVDAAMNLAAQNVLNLGVRRFEEEQYLEAIDYFDLLLSETGYNSSIKASAQDYHSKALAADTNQESAVMYQAVLDSNFATESWALALQYQEAFGNVSSEQAQVNAAMNHAAQNVLSLGIRRFDEKQYSVAIEYFDLLLSETGYNSSIKANAKDYYSKALAADVKEESNAMYQAVLDSDFATESWELARVYYEAYGDVTSEQAQVRAAIDHAAQNVLNLGIRRYEANNYPAAMDYFSILRSSPALNATMKETVEVYITRMEVSSETMYQAVVDSKYASESWDLAQEYKIVYGDDKAAQANVKDAINLSANNLLSLAIRRYEEKNYQSASEYLKIVLSEALISQDIADEAVLYQNKILVAQSGTTPASLYEAVMSAQLASEAWDNAQLYKELYGSIHSEKERVKEVINYAAQNMFDLAVKRHNQGNYNSALSYYEILSREPLINRDFTSSLNELTNLAKNSQKIKSVAQYRNEILAIQTASGRWDAVIQALAIYPDNAQLVNLLDDVAINNLNLGRKNHRNNDASSASTYYQRIINEKRVDQSIRTLATVFLNQVSENHRPIVYLDIGHGGSDPGATHYGVLEKDLNMQISGLLRSELEDRGYIVVMSRTSDKFVGLTERAMEANQINSDIFISVHHNSMGGTGQATGIETFVFRTVAGGFGQETNHSNFELDNPRISESLELANTIHSNLIKDTSMYNRGVKGNNYNVLRNTNVPAVLLELGFMDNQSELNRIKSSSYQRTAAKSIANGIDDYFKAISN